MVSVPPSAADVLPCTATPVDKALSLLRRADIEPPAGDPSSAAWLTALIDAPSNRSGREPLTALANRCSFEPTRVPVIDMDPFNAVNDRYGLLAGDQVPA